MLKVAAWKGRGKVPVSIELTASLIEVVRKDENASTKGKRVLLSGLDSSSSRSEMENRLLYAMALTRVVNGLVAPFQQTVRAKSVSVVCQTLGLPLNLVELRHEAAHAEIPNLAALRPVAISCLHWLYERYWLRQQQYFEDTERTTTELLAKLAKFQKKISSDSFGPETRNYAAIKKHSKTLVHEMMNNLTYSQVLICLVPKFANLLLPTNVTATQLERKVVELPRRLQVMWMGIITKFVKKWDCFLPALLVEIIECLFRVTALLPRFNPTLPPLSNLLLEGTYKFQIAILKCWYEHLIHEFFDMRVSSERVEEISSNTSNTGENGQTGEESGDANEDSETPASSDATAAETHTKRLKPKKESHRPQKKQKGGPPRFLLSNDLLPFKSILHACLQHLNKHSVKLIKLTVCYMSDGAERDAILPKLSTLFHFRSRALNLTRAEQTLAYGGPEERVQQLSKRAESTTAESKPQTELSLNDFESILRASSSPQPLAIASTTSPLALSPTYGRSITPTAAGTEPRGNSSPNPSTVSPLPVRPGSTTTSAWTLLEGMPPGLCQSPNGSYDYSLPSALDDFRLAVFLVPKHTKQSSFFSVPALQPIFADSSAGNDPDASVDEYSVLGGYSSSEDEEVEQGQVERKEKPERTTESDEDAPEAKRRCLEPSPEQLAAIAAAEKKKEEQATAKAVAEKAKVKLMVGIKKTVKK